MDSQAQVTLTINGTPVAARAGQNVLDAALEAGIYIPHLCHHPSLRPQGGCKLCSVEIEGREGIVSSCETPVEEGLVVHTATPAVTHLRQVATELLLACHPADCTSCKAYLNCELQALMQYLGVAHSRLRHVQKHNTALADGPANPLMKREMERCIQCGRCVRACGELRGVGALEYRQTDGESYVGVKDGVSLTESDCRFCGACVEVCPTGAIQDMPGIFPADVSRAEALVPCKNGCPAHTDIPLYLRLAGQQRYPEAVEVLREKLTFPHSLGLVCTHKCEAACKRGALQDAVSIREVKRFAVEQDTAQSWKAKVTKHPPTGKRVSIVGAGPAGLTAAWHLARKGHEVTVLEKQENPGGMLRYGIPGYRLPDEVIDAEVAQLAGMGFTILTDTRVASAGALRKNCDALLVAVGAQKGANAPAEAATCNNIWAAVDFCRWGNQNRLPDMGDTLTVLGGGNVAFDCARTARKNGVPHVRLICLEARENMLCDAEELEAALSEGVEVINSCSCTRLQVEGTAVTGLDMVEVERFSFGPKGLELDVRDGSLRHLATSSLVYATGQQIDLNADFGLTLGRGNSVVVNENHAASIDGIFAAGDATTGTRSVVEAIAAGTAAAASIDRYLGGDGNMEQQYWQREPLEDEIGTIKDFATLPRAHEVCSDSGCNAESVRCLQCDLRLKFPKVRYWGDAHYQKSRKEARE